MNRKSSRRVVVPRFRRLNFSNENVDIDDIEAQREIDEQLKSVFIWSSDLPNVDQMKFNSFDNQIEEKINEQFISDEILSNQIDFQSSDQNFLTRTFSSIENLSSQIDFSEDSTKNFREKYFQLKTSDEEQINEQQFDLIDFHSNVDQQFNLNSNEEIHLDYENDSSQLTIQTNLIDHRSSIEKIIYSLECFDEDLKRNELINIDDENEMKILYDCQMKTKEIHLNIFDFIDNEFDEKKRFLFDENSFYFFSIYFDLNEKNNDEFDSFQIQFNSSIEPKLDLFIEDFHCQWSIELINQRNENKNEIFWNFNDGENIDCRYSIEINENDFIRLSFDELFLLNKNRFYSLKDFHFDRFYFDFICSSRKETKMIYSLIDQNEKKQNFGEDFSFDSSQWFYLQQLRTNNYQISFDESFQCIYSFNDISSLNLQSIISFDDQITQRLFRKYRCKHLSIKSDFKDQFDLISSLSIDEQRDKQILSPKENLDEQIQNDFNEDIYSFRDPIDNYQKFNNETTNEIQMDFIRKDEENRSLICLKKEDYLRPPPPTWRRLKKEIGFISFNGNDENPQYELNRSNKRFVYFPKENKDLSISIYEGFEEFINEIRLNPTNYFRSFDHLDLRPLLFWYINKQYLFSSNDKKCLKPPNFLCRRSTLVKILSNLYCDDQSWKLFVFRFKGQFYLSLSNKEKKQIDQMTKDEYAGFHFESILTCEQPNSTRKDKSFPLKNPQKQFHSIQFWNFGRFNLLYSNEIDAQIHSSQLSNIQQNKNKNEKMKLTNEIDQYLQMNSMNLSEDEEQTKENLQMIFDDDEDDEENKEKKNRNEGLNEGYVEIKCTKRKIFYRDENKLQTLHWWAQIWLANIQNLIVGYKDNQGIIDQIDYLSQRDLISKFLSKFDLKLKYCLSYFYSFLELIERIVTIDDLQTIHVFAYIPQPIDLTSEDHLPSIIPFRYDRINRSIHRHGTFIPQFYLEYLLRSSQFEFHRNISFKSIDEELHKRYSHRGRSSCPLQQQKQSSTNKKKSSAKKSIQR